MRLTPHRLIGPNPDQCREPNHRRFCHIGYRFSRERQANRPLILTVAPLVIAYVSMSFRSVAIITIITRNIIDVRGLSRC